MHQWQVEALFKTRRKYIQAVKELDKLAGKVDDIDKMTLQAVDIMQDVDQPIGYFPKKLVLLLIARSRAEHVELLEKVDAALLQHGVTVEKWYDYVPKPEVPPPHAAFSLDEFLESLNDQAQSAV